MYCLPEDYVGRATIKNYDDRKSKDEFQDNVYSYAKDILEENKYSKVLDVGCGSGFKLIKYFNNYETIGIDIEPCYSFLKETYPNKIWYDSIDKVLTKQFDLIICSDVIEHVENPTDFLVTINRIDFKKMIMSTPNRDAMTKFWGEQYKNYPWNECHFREWTLDEFNKYISDKFNIVNHFYDQKFTQIVELTKLPGEIIE